MKNISLEICKNCGSTKFKKWRDLTDDEKFIAERLFDKKESSNQEIKKQRFCSRCFYLKNEISKMI